MLNGPSNLLPDIEGNSSVGQIQHINCTMEIWSVLDKAALVCFCCVLILSICSCPYSGYKATDVTFIVWQYWVFNKRTRTLTHTQLNCTVRYPSLVKHSALAVLLKLRSRRCKNVTQMDGRNAYLSVRLPIERETRVEGLRLHDVAIQEIKRAWLKKNQCEKWSGSQQDWWGLWEESPTAHPTSLTKSKCHERRIEPLISWLSQSD